MSFDQMLTSVVAQIPNMAGLIFAIMLQQQWIRTMAKRIETLEKQIENQTGVIISLSHDKLFGIKSSSGLD